MKAAAAYSPLSFSCAFRLCDDSHARCAATALLISLLVLCLCSPSPSPSPSPILVIARRRHSPLYLSSPPLSPSPRRNLEFLASLGDNASTSSSFTFLPTCAFSLVEIAASSSSFAFYLSPGDKLRTQSQTPFLPYRHLAPSHGLHGYEGSSSNIHWIRGTHS
jgi:hypothetical protein